MKYRLVDYVGFGDSSKSNQNYNKKNPGNFLAHPSTECSVSYCNHSPSVGVRPTSVHNFLVNTLASTNINQSAPNLVKMFMTIRSRMSLIMDLIRPELSQLFALEFAKIAESDLVYTSICKY